MRCWLCKGPADGVCRFCGRGVCEEHYRPMAFVLTVFPTSAGLEGLAVDDVLHCGVCRPRSQPIAMEFLEPSGR